MHIFEGRYFNINRRLLRCLGLWPYEMKVKKNVLRAIFIGVITLFMIPQVLTMIIHYKNIDRLMFSILGFTTLMLMNLKMITMILAEENMKALHKSIANNWHLIQDQNERDILHKYSERARTATIFYAAFMATAAATGPLFPLIPKLLDIVRPLENPRPNLYVTEGEYLVDREAHFTLTFCMNYITVMLIAIVVIPVDTMYIVSVEHCCALYAIIRYRLSQLRRRVQESSSATGDGDENSSATGDSYESYEWLCRTIQLHQNALNFVRLVDDSYSTTFLYLAIAALYIIPLNSCAIIANLHNSIHLIPFVMYLVALMIHGFFLVLPGQRIIDHELDLLNAAYCNEWYGTPLRTRKLLLIFMIRCSQLPTLTAGGLLPVNFEVFFKIMKTSISYITVASSFR